MFWFVLLFYHLFIIVRWSISCLALKKTAIKMWRQFWNWGVLIKYTNSVKKIWLLENFWLQKNGCTIISFWNEVQGTIWWLAICFHTLSKNSHEQKLLQANCRNFCDILCLLHSFSTKYVPHNRLLRLFVLARFSLL